jgi:hypothetical protein
VALRRALLDLGIGLWHRDPAAQAYAGQLRQRGKPGGIIACALAHRAGKIAYAMVRDQKPYAWYRVLPGSDGGGTGADEQPPSKHARDHFDPRRARHRVDQRLTSTTGHHVPSLYTKITDATAGAEHPVPWATANAKQGHPRRRRGELRDHSPGITRSPALVLTSNVRLDAETIDAGRGSRVRLRTVSDWAWLA